MTSTTAFYITPVLDMLTRQRTTLTSEGTLFDAVLSRAALLEQHLLIEVTGHQRPTGHLIFQGGRLVYAQYADLNGLTALAEIQGDLSQSTLRLFALDSVLAALAFAALDGQAQSAGLTDSSEVTTRLSVLMRRRFTGVVAARVRSSLVVWQLLDGKLQAKQDQLAAGPFRSIIELAWRERRLPTLDDQAPLSPPVVGQPAPGSGLPEATVMWALFEQVLTLHLGPATDRLVRLLRVQHGREQGAELRESLGRQVDRVAGPGVGQRFRATLS